MANGRKPAQATASGLEPVLKPATCRRPARIASICAAFDCTGKNCTFLPVTSSMCVEEAGPDLGVDGRILDRRVGEDQRAGIDQLARIRRDVGDQVAVGIGEARVELELGLGSAGGKKCHDGSSGDDAIDQHRSFLRGCGISSWKRRDIPAENGNMMTKPRIEVRSTITTWP